MRTLKKTLCLVLAVVMLLGLGAFSVGATDYSDDASIGAGYKEAVSVLSEIGVLTGKDTGAYDPQGNLTRVEGCYIVTKLLGVSPSGGVTSFSDVSAQDAPYVAYCQAVGIVAGYPEDNTFRPSEPLTYAMFAKWCLTALGYNADVEGMTGLNWQGGVATLVTHTNLAKNVPNFSLGDTITREEAAQIGLNTLEATMVEYSGGVNVVTDTGTDVTVNAARSNVTAANTAAWANAIHQSVDGAGNRYVELGELVFNGNLRLLDTTDDFGAPADQWTYNAKALTAPQTNTPVVTYTSSKTNAAGKAAVRSDLTGFYALQGVNVYLNGANISAVTAASAGTTGNTAWNGGTILGLLPVTKNGAATINVQELVADLTADGREVAVYNSDDTDNQRVTDIVIKQYDLFEVTSKLNNTVTLTNRTSGQLATAAINSVRYGFKYSTAGQGGTDVTATNSNTNNKFFTQLNALNNKDFVLAAVQPNGTTADVKIIDIGEYKTASGTFTNYSSDKFTIGGTVYPVATNANTQFGAGTITIDGTANRVDGSIDYSLYLDATGSALLYAKTNSDTSKNYAQILSLSRDGTAQSGYSYSAKLLFADGSTKWVPLHRVTMDGGTTMIKPENYPALVTGATQGGGITGLFVQYRENTDGTYNFVNTPAAGTNSTAAGESKITKGDPNMKFNGTASAYTLTSKTAVIIKSGATNTTYTSYVGIANLPTITSSTANAFTVYCASGTIANMIIVDNTLVGITGKTATYLLVYDALHVGTSISGDDTIYTYKAIKDGVDTTVQTKNLQIANGLYMNVVYDAEEYVTSVGTRMHVGTANGDVTLGTTVNNTAIYNSATTIGNVKAYVADSVLHVDLTTAVDQYVTDTSGALSTANTTTDLTMPVASDFVVYLVKANQSSNNLRQITLGTNTSAASWTTGINGDSSNAGNGFTYAILTANGDGEITAMYITDNATGGLSLA